MTAALASGMEHCCLGDGLLLEILNVAMALQARALKDGEAVAMAEAVLHCRCHRHCRILSALRATGGCHSKRQRGTRLPHR